MNMYLVGVLFAALSMIKLGPWVGFIILGIWGLICIVYKKIELSIRIKRTEPGYGKSSQKFFSGTIVADSELKSVQGNEDCVAKYISTQPMSSSFFPPMSSIELGENAGINIGKSVLKLDTVEKITGDNVYMMPTEIDSKEGKGYGIIQIQNIKKYMVIESILKNNEKVLVNGYVDEDGRICASEIVGMSDKVVNQRFLASKSIFWFSLLLISFGLFMLVTF